MTTLRAIAAAVALWATGAGAAPADAVPASSAWVKISAPELAGRYDTLWALSDVHGRREELEQLLAAAHLAVRRGPTLAWNPQRGRDLLVVAGDLVDGGPDSAGVVLLLERLESEAAAAGSRVVVLLGNHEARLLAHPRSATPELLASAAGHAAELGLPVRPTPRDVERSELARYLRGLPVAAFVGSWLFAHAGYLDAGDGEAELRAWLARLDAAMAARDREAFAALLDPRSIVEYHDWWRSRSRTAAMRGRLGALGLDGLVIGHDPDALGAVGTMAMNRDGWLVKLDAGLKTGASRGMLLRCEVRAIVGGDALAMARDGSPTCAVEGPDGSVRPLPVR